MAVFCVYKEQQEHVLIITLLLIPVLFLKITKMIWQQRRKKMIQWGKFLSIMNIKNVAELTILKSS